MRRLVQESIAFVYADGGEAWLDEDAPAIGGGVTTTARDAERNARERFDGDTVVLRFGLFMGPDSGFTSAALDAAREGDFGGDRAARRLPADAPARGRIGGDRRGAARSGRDVQRRGADPPTNAEVDAALAAAVGRRTLRPGAPREGPLARSQRVSTRRLREATGWAPRVRAGTEIWAHMAAHAVA